MEQLLNEKRLRKVSPTALLRAGSDVALLLDHEGTVLEVTYGEQALADVFANDWCGQRWIDTVTDESRGKIEGLLEAAHRNEEPRWFQVNHPCRVTSRDRPLRYCTLPINGGKQYLALGRDMQPIADLQQELIAVQETAERDYWRLRQAESRFRLLMQISPEPLLVADSASERILELNPAAETALEHSKITSTTRLSGLFDAGSVRGVQDLLARAMAAGHADASGLVLRSSDTPVGVSAYLLRQGNAGIFVIRLADVDRGGRPVDREKARLLQLLMEAPEAIVLTDETGAVVSCNPAFVELVQLASPEQALGESLATWLGRSTVDVNVLIANLRKSDRIRLFSTTVRGAHGVSDDVEVSATMLQDESEQKFFGFLIHSVSRRASRAGVSETAGRAHSIEQLTELVGKVPLKELVRESADLIERLSIEAALNLTSNNRAAAAEMLGLSRQSLYVKMRRYEISEPKHSDN